jgi:hypothetical protein
MLDWISESGKDVNTFKIIISALEWAQVNLGSNTRWNSLQVQFMDLRDIVLHCMVANICSVAVNSISFTPKVTLLLNKLLRVELDALTHKALLSLSVLKRLLMSERRPWLMLKQEHLLHWKYEWETVLLMEMLSEDLRWICAHILEVTLLTLKKAQGVKYPWRLRRNCGSNVRFLYTQQCTPLKWNSL